MEGIPMPITIIEIKAFCKEQEKIRDILNSENAIFKGRDHQVDTYFNVPNGRLKLREGSIENNLIHYERSDQKGPKSSSVLLYKSDLDSNLKQILERSLGVLTVINKQREIYFIDNIKFHIDEVKDLGSFVEIEAIDETGTIAKEKLKEQCEHYLEKFALKNEDLVECSYSDLLIKI